MPPDFPTHVTTNTTEMPVVNAQFLLQFASQQMRRFVVDRKSDITGISGTGVILYGVEWTRGGPCDVYWLRTQTTGQYPSIDVVRSTHCYGGNAEIIYLD